MRPTVAVIIPTMNNRDDLTIESIRSALCQTVPAHEIFIICEQGPLNDLITRINYTIQNMTSTHFVWLCDDDLLKPDFIEQTTAHIDGHDIVYTGMDLFGTSNHIEHARQWGEDIKHDTIPFISSLCSKEMFLKVGGFDHVVFCDWDFWWKCYEANARAYRLDLPLWSHRQHPGQSSNRINWQSCREEVLAKHQKVA